LQITETGEVVNASSEVDINRIEVLIFPYQTIHFMPTFNTVLARRLVGLRINSCGMKMINKENLQQFESLEFLDFSYNQFMWLAEDLFEFSTKLKYVSFYGNELIDFIGADILAPLTNLQGVYFQNLKCMSTYATTADGIKDLKATLKTKCTNQVFANIQSKLSSARQSLGTAMKQLETKTQQLSSAHQNLDSATRLLSFSMFQMQSSLADGQVVQVVCGQLESPKACELIDLRIEQPATKINFSADKNANQPTRVSIRHQSVWFLPINVGEAFPGLRELEISASGLFFVDRKSFFGLNILETLNLTANKLTIIGEETFLSLEQLKTLDLSHNNIEVILPTTFAGLDVLKVLNLNGNKLSDVGSNFFSPMKSLKSLDLSGNFCVDSSFPAASLDAVKAEIARKCFAPIELNCASSDDRQTCKVENLKILTEARIYRVKQASSCQQDLGDIRSLLIVNQIVRFLPLQLAKTFANLQKLIVVSSQLTCIRTQDFSGFWNLQWIEISGNNLTTIEANAFDGVAQLQHLDLSSNHIQSLPSQLFQPLINLKQLKLSNNEIKVLNADVLPPLNAIEVFEIDDNKLEEIKNRILRILKKATKINLSGNICIDKTYERKDENYLEALNMLQMLVSFNCGSVFKDSSE
jgi:Leucine-rich repeat (LRR) protein